MAEEIKDIEKFESRNLPDTRQIAIPQSNGFLSVIERLSKVPDIPIEKIQQLMDMERQGRKDIAEQEFNAAMSRVQSKMPTVPKDQYNDHTKSHYSSYAMILRHAQPIYGPEGFSVLMYEGVTEVPDNIRVDADVMHSMGHTKKVWMDMPIDNKGKAGTINKTGPHAKKSSTSYARGALMCMIFNIPTGDGDDGNAAGEPIAFINDKQLGQIVDMINAKNVDETVFLSYMKVGSAEEIKQVDFKKAMAALNKAKGRDREPGGEG